MDDQEQHCEDALFELCDARERYPLRCADELQKCIQLKNDICMMKVFQKSNLMNKFPVLEENIDINTEFNEKDTCFEYLDRKLQNIMDKLDNLKAVIQQIEREKTCEINKLLKK